MVLNSTLLLNETGVMGDVLSGLTTGVTGSLFLSLLLIVLLILGLAIAFRIPIEYTAIFITPMILVLMAYTGGFMLFGSVLLIYLALIFAKNFPIK